MSRLRTIARRSFLFGSVAIAGGVAFGAYMVRKPHDNPLVDGLAPDEATFNPWVRISGDGITLITPHTDLGQGAASMQAALIAEEMDLEFGQFETDFGPPSAAYYNTAIGAEGAPFLTTDDSLTANLTRGVMGSAIKLLGMQLTGGSSSVADSFDKLRQAGAIARETLKLAAAQQTGIAVGLLKTQSGAVIRPDGTRLAYTALAARAAMIEPVRDVPLRPSSEWRLIGKPMQRLDIVAKSTGILSYGIDLKIDGMVYAAVKLNPRRAPMNGFDGSGAKDMRGVQRILPVTNGVAVIADNTWRAFQAVDAVACDWGDASYPAEMEAHWAEVEASFTPERLDKEWRHEGDVPAALNAYDTIEAKYRAPYLAHQPLEPLSAIVTVTEGRVEVWVAHQMPRFLQTEVAKITGHSEDQVILHNQYAGGSFGHRLEFENVKLATEIANQMRGTPVKLTFNREQDFAQDFGRHISAARGRGVVRDGRVEALDLQIASTSASRSQMGRIGQSIPGADAQIPAGAWNAPYALPNFRITAYAVPELAPVSSWRSVGASSGGFYMESFLDELIHAAGADPMAERLRLCNYDLARKTLEAVAEMSDWGRVLGPNEGRGVALVESFGVPVAEVVDVTATESGIRVDRVYVAAEVGQIVDPVNFENHVQRAVVWALGHAMNCELTYSDGMAEQRNFDSYQGMRLYQCPQIMVRGLENGPKVRGIGEPPVPPAAPALANAIFAATGQRLREMPFDKVVDFV